MKLVIDKDAAQREMQKSVGTVIMIVLILSPHYANSWPKRHFSSILGIFMPILCIFFSFSCANLSGVRSTLVLFLTLFACLAAQELSSQYPVWRQGEYRPRSKYHCHSFQKGSKITAQFYNNTKISPFYWMAARDISKIFFNKDLKGDQPIMSGSVIRLFGVTEKIFFWSTVRKSVQKMEKKRR